MIEKDYYKKIYQFDKGKNAYIVDIALDSYTDPLNDWDKSPIRKRDIDPELINFLEEISMEIPLKEKLLLRLFIPEDKRDSLREKKLQEAIKNYFMYQMLYISKKRGEHLKQALIYVLISIVVLALSLNITKYLKMPFLELLNEGLTIGGWVFLWEAFDYLFFRNSKNNRKYREYRRFYNAELNFVYSKKNKELLI